MTQQDSVQVMTGYYRQFDADHSREVPGENYEGWKKELLPLSLRHTAFVIMHAWDAGNAHTYPGWYRAVEYLPRANHIVKMVFPDLVRDIREAGMPLFHVVSEGQYYKKHPGYRAAKELAGEPPPPPPNAAPDAVHEVLRDFQAKKIFPGEHNLEDIEQGFIHLDIPREVYPREDEGIAESAAQLYALCAKQGINHLIYTGFAINWCLLSSPGGMIDMSRRGMLCSTIREAITAVENKETARNEGAKEQALWRVGLGFGFVYDIADISDFLRQATGKTKIAT